MIITETHDGEPLTDEQIAATAREALDILDRDGWNKGALTVITPDGMTYYGKYPEGSHCIGGAWNLALTGRSDWAMDHTAAYLPLAAKIADMFPAYGNTETETGSYLVMNFIARWNNDKDTTEEDVRAVLGKLCS